MKPFRPAKKQRITKHAMQQDKSTLIGKRRLKLKGREFGWAYRLFAEQQERGNDYIDLHDAFEDWEVPVCIETLRKLGFKKFTFSSTWSNAVETAWIFTNCGCTLKGLIEINSQYASLTGEGYEKAHGYLFSID